MNRASAYWYTSALVPLFVRQSSSVLAVSLYKTYDAVVWWATPVEIVSAIAHLLRIGQITAAEFAKARGSVKSFAAYWMVVAPSDAVRAAAIKLVRRYNLRAADSLQLAAALRWCENFPNGRTFLSGDKRLHDSALLAGFDARRI